jgi:hypothetical protein
MTIADLMHFRVRHELENLADRKLPKVELNTNG